MVRGTAQDPRPSEIRSSPGRIEASVTDFEELEPIGSGGNADVTKQAYEGPGPDVVALKQPRMRGTLDVESVQQFTDEAETWEKLDDHDHIVRVLDYDSDPFPWIALEYMDGGSLEDRLGDIEPAEALWIGVCVARAVRHAHRRGVAHLDLKPDNVLFRETEDRLWDVPKVTDWGLAKMLLEHSKSVEGLTPDYAAPEQFDSETYGPPDDLTDIYATGALVYAALTGDPPFTGASASVMQDVLHTEPTPPSEHADGLPEGTDAVVTRALAKDKDDRYESVLDLRRDLETLVERALGDGSEGSLIAEGGVPSTGRSTRSASADSQQPSEPGTGQARQPLNSGGGQTSQPPEPGSAQTPQSQESPSEDVVTGDLLEIDGIGTTYAQKLQRAGIQSVADVSMTTASEVATVADVSNSRAETWVDRANEIIEARRRDGTVTEEDVSIPNYHYYMVGTVVLFLIGGAIGNSTGGLFAIAGFGGFVYYWNKDMKTIQNNAHVDWFPMRFLYFFGALFVVPVLYYFYKRSAALKKATVEVSG